MTDYRDDPEVQDIVRKVRALRLLTKQTRVFTTRSQGVLLQSLTPEKLAAAAEILTMEKEGQANEQLSHK